MSDADGGVIRKYNGLGGPDPSVPSFGAKGTGVGQLLSPRGLTVDAAGSVYVADPGNGKVAKFSPSGQLQQEFAMPAYTIVANGQTLSGRIDPRDVAVDGSGRVFVPDAGTNSNLVAVFSANGGLEQVFGSPISDPSNACRVSGPWGVAVSGATLYVVSTGENRIRVFGESGSPCPTPNFGSGGGFDPSGGSSGGGGGSIAGPSGRVTDTQPPRVSFSGFPCSRCARRDFALMIHAADDVGISKLIVFVNRRRVASQPVAGHPTWNVRVNIPVRKVRRALTSGASVKVRIDAKVVDVAGKKADAKRTFRICD